MKIDKRNPKHWAYLALFTFNVCIGVVARWVVGSRSQEVILYGHKLNGNLRALYDRLTDGAGPPVTVHFLTLDPGYFRELRRGGESCLSGLNVTHMLRVCRAECIVTDHGLHSLTILARLSNVKLVDLWHGIPFKGFDEKDFRWLRSYKAVCVTSPAMKKIYVSRFGISEKKLRITGYGRTDRLYLRHYNKAELMAKYSELPKSRGYVLFAPTWNHGQQSHREVPFSKGLAELCTNLTPLMEELNYTLIVRTHLNTKQRWHMGSSRVALLPMDEYPQSEEILFLSEALICDWSSIAFDYLVLRRPTIFIGCRAPFKKGFTYGPEYRFGPIVTTLEQLKEVLVRYLRDPSQFENEYGVKMTSVSGEVYSDYLDGKATQRYIRELLNLLGEK